MRTGIGSSLRYKFSHDQIQAFAYSLTPEEDRPLLHLRIGRLLYSNAAYYDEVDKKVFIIVEQLNRGKDLIDGEERLSLAKLNLTAGERSIQSSAFVPALTYLRIGLSLLTPNEMFSSEHYDMSLRLYSSTAEAEFVNGNIGEMEDAVAVISKNAVCFLDRFPSYLCLVKSYISQGRVDEAISTGFGVLSKLGEPFPKSSGTFTTIRDHVKTKNKLRGKTDDQLKELPIMKDDSKIAAMRMLNLMYSCCYICKPDLLPLVTFRMVRLSVKYGLSYVSAFAFAAYGMIVSAFLGNSKEGNRFGKIALSILEKFDTKELTSRTVAIVWFFITPWREHSLCDSLEHFTNASKIGMEVGDHEYALYNLTNFTTFSLFCGRPLAILQDECAGFQEYASSLNQDIAKQIITPFRQGMLNLMGRSDDPLILRGAAMNEDDFFETEVPPQNHPFMSHLVLYNRMFLAYTFGEYKVAAEIADMSRTSISKALPGMFIVVNHVFYDGLAASALARESKASNRKYKKTMKVAIKKMKTWTAQTPSNCLHKLRLLEAEHDVMRRKKTSACKAYEAAIEAAHKSGVTQDEALAHERAALFFRELGDEKKASRYLAIAHQLYLDWGADAKSSQLQTQYSTMVSQARKRRSFQDYMVCRTASVSPKVETS
uniref:Uncharacterized protein n=1 Tax=Helicotheca tamesis TaxID=374047 RepID=A0A7S2DVG6_9STRA